MNIKKTFINLTQKTYPHGTEEGVLKHIPLNLKQDNHGNYFYKIGKSETVFASHLDTVSKIQTKVNHVIEGNMIKTDGTSILGADDKAGVTILLYLITHNIPGLYYFFVGEEVGCIGSGKASDEKELFSKYKRIISFDRRGTTSVITHQSSKRCCSDEFADNLIKEFTKGELKMVKDDGGVYTDSAEFISVIPECTNISVGYYKEHTHQESQDIDHLEKLAKACVLVDWENLPSNRDVTKIEWKSYSNYTNSNYSGYSPSWRNRDNDWESERGSYNRHSWQDNDWDEEEYPVKRKERFTSSTPMPWDEDFKSVCDLDDESGLSYESQIFNQKRNKRSTKSKTYYNSLNNEIRPIDNLSFMENEDVDNDPDDPRYNKNYYEGLKEYFMDDSITERDVEILQNQFFNVEDDEDLAYLDYLHNIAS